MRAHRAPQKSPRFTSRPNFCHSAPMETHALGFRPRANAPEGQKRSPISQRKHVISAAFRPYVPLVCLLVVLATAVRGAEPSESPDGKILAGELLRYLGLNPQAKRAELEAGEVVHNGLAGREELPDEIAAAGAMLLVKASEPGAVIDAFLDAETFLRVHKVRRYQALKGGRAELAAFSTMTPPDVSRLREVNKAPAGYLNLSAAEATKLKSVNPKEADLAGRVRTTLAEIFASRVTQYARQGISGIQPYVREKGEVVNPAVELRSAIRSVAFLAGAFPELFDTLGAPATKTAPGLRRDYYWMERRVEAEPVVALSAELRLREDRAAIGADVHFYASREYNAMLTVVGVVPYGPDWMVFALNHVFTDQVLGFGSSMKRRVGRDLVAAQLGKQLAETRRRLAARATR